VDKGQQKGLQEEIGPPPIFPLGFIWTQGVELLFIKIKVSHEGLGCSWRSHSFVEIR
jgi:hypothetical protein